MANLCFNSTYLIGDVDTLKNIANVAESVISDVISKMLLPECSYEELQRRLGFECHGWGQSYDEGLHNINMEKIEEGVLILHGITAWGNIPKYWEALCEKFNLQYVDYIDLDEGLYVINDSEHLFIKTDYRLELESQEAMDFFDVGTDTIHMTENEFQEFVIGVVSFENMLDVTGEDFNDFLEENDFGRLISVLREGEQVYPPKIEKDADIEETLEI